MSELSFKSFRLSSIRTQILLGFGLILSLTLIIILVNFLTLRILQANIEDTVEEAGRIRDLGSQIQNDFLIARQEESLFLDNWRTIGFEAARQRHADANRESISNARAALVQLNEIVESSNNEQLAGLLEQSAELGPLLDAYDAAFLATVNRIDERSRAGGLERRFENTINGLEGMAVTIPDSAELNRTIVQMSANEQAYFNTGEQQYLDQARLLAIQSRNEINGTPHLGWAFSDLARPLVLIDLYDHVDAFNELVLLEGEIEGNIAIFREVTSDINELSDNIGDFGEAALEESREQLQSTVLQSNLISLVTGVIAMVIGLITALLLGQRILGPLGELTDAAIEIGRGNLNQTISIAGQDEFATLGNVFNQMTEQLRGLIGSLEQLVADRTRALATSFQVSRRLSTILDRQQLLNEVVEQVRGAFDYYHAHIYLFDNERRHLLMVGGTGEAGRAMLAAGHQLESGQGLVGKAATTNRPVIVADVDQDPNWLPNPLLPETKSEIAVPISLGDQVVGVLDVQHNIRGGLDQSDADLLQSIANQVAIALQNARLYEEAQKTADREMLLNEISQKIQKAGSVDGVLEVAARELGIALKAKRTSVQLMYPERPAKKSTTNGREQELER